MLDKVDCGLCHASSQARGAETQTLIRETHDDALGALWTRQDREASRKHATIDVTLELILHERGQWCGETLLGGGVERAQVVAHDLVQGALLRTPPGSSEPRSVAAGSRSPDGPTAGADLEIAVVFEGQVGAIVPVGAGVP